MVSMMELQIPPGRSFAMTVALPAHILDVTISAGIAGI
jgi:hypothetical protein